MIKLLEDATIYPVTLAEAKAQSNVEISEDDDLITQAIAAATELVESKTSLQLAERTYLQSYPCFYTRLDLIKMPVKEIVEITYYDTDNVLQTLDPATYTLLNPERFRAWIDQNLTTPFPATYARADAVNVEYTTGINIIPQRAIHLIKYVTKAYYDTRGIDEKTLDWQTFDRACSSLRSF